MSLRVRICLLLLSVVLLASCSSTPKQVPLPKGVDISAIPEPVPRDEPRSAYGNPESYVQNGERYWVIPNGKGFVETGIASWYGQQFDGRRTSSGETYNMYDMTAAHKTLPLPSYVRVKVLKTGKSVVVRLNDRGPFISGRIIDLSYAAAAKLGIAEQGTAAVEIRVLDPANFQSGARSAKTTAVSVPVAAAPVAVSTPEPAPAMVIQGAATASDSMVGSIAPPPPQVSAAQQASEIYIQIGAYAKENSAQDVREALGNAQEHQVFIAPIDSVMGRLHRVRIGPFGSKEEAETLFPLLHKKGYYQSRIIRN